MAGGQSHPQSQLADKPRLLLQALLGLGVGLSWLLVLGLFQQFEPLLGAAFVSAIGLTFYALHGHLAKPAAWSYQRLGGFDRQLLAPALALVLVLTALQICLYLMYGDTPTTRVTVPGLNAANPWPLAFAAVLVAPLVEEFGFRLWLQSPLEQVLTPMLAVLLSACVFTAVHGFDGWYSHLLSGLCYGLALWLSGSIWLPVAMHATSNLSIALLNSSTAVREVLQHWALAQGPSLTWMTLVLGLATAVGTLLWIRQARTWRTLQANPNP